MLQFELILKRNLKSHTLKIDFLSFYIKNKSTKVLSYNYREIKINNKNIPKLLPRFLLQKWENSSSRSIRICRSGEKDQLREFL